MSSDHFAVAFPNDGGSIFQWMLVVLLVLPAVNQRMKAVLLHWLINKMRIINSGTLALTTCV